MYLSPVYCNTLKTIYLFLYYQSVCTYLSSSLYYLYTVLFHTHHLLSSLLLLFYNTEHLHARINECLSLLSLCIFMSFCLSFYHLSAKKCTHFDINTTLLNLNFSNYHTTYNILFKRKNSL